MRFQIVRGQPFECTITLKATGSITGITLDPSDTATFTLTQSNNNCMVLSQIPMTIEDANNGKFKLTLTAEQTQDLYTDNSFREDGSKPLVTHKGLIIAQTKEEGQIIGNIPFVYVWEAGEACTA